MKATERFGGQDESNRGSDPWMDKPWPLLLISKTFRISSWIDLNVRVKKNNLRVCGCFMKYLEIIVLKHVSIFHFLAMEMYERIDNQIC